MTSYTIEIPGKAVGKGRPRAVRRGNHATVYTPQATVNAEAWIKQCAVSQVGALNLKGPLDVWIDIAVPIAESWSKRRKADIAAGLERPTSKPDIDNVTKLLLDSLNGIVWGDDSQVVRLTVAKHYGPEPKTVLMVSTL